MRSEFAFLFPKPVKTARRSKPRAKTIKVGTRIKMHNDGNEYTIVERDTRYKNAWFIVNDAGERSPYSFTRDMMAVL